MKKHLKKIAKPLALAASMFTAACGPTPPSVEQTKDKVKISCGSESCETREGIKAISDACRAAVSKCCRKDGGGYCGDTNEVQQCEVQLQQDIKAGKDHSTVSCTPGSSQEIEIEQ